MSGIGEERFEELLGAMLISGLTEDERAEFVRFIAESSEFMERYQRALILQDLLQNPVDLTGGREVRGYAQETKDNNKPSKVIPFGSGRRKKIAIALTAAASVLSIPVYFMVMVRNVTTTLVAGVGTCTLDGEPLVLGESRPIGLISSGEGSRCVFRIDYRQPLLMDLAGRGEVRTESGEKIGLHLTLVFGDVLMDTGKPAGEKDIFLIIDKFSYQFVGTRIHAKNEIDERSLVEVVDGKLRVQRSRDHSLEDRHKEVEPFYLSAGEFTRISPMNELDRISAQKIKPERLELLEGDFEDLSRVLELKKIDKTGHSEIIVREEKKHQPETIVRPDANDLDNADKVRKMQIDNDTDISQDDEEIGSASVFQIIRSRVNKAREEIEQIVRPEN